MIRIVRSPWGPAPAPGPEGVVLAAVGDVHGMSALHDALMTALASDIDAFGAPTVLVHIGDYVDRGPETRAVLNRVRAGLNRADVREAALKGNHESWLLDLLTVDRDAAFGDLGAAEFQDWFDHGGDATLRAFRVDPRTPTPARDLAAALTPEETRFLKSLEICRREGPYLFVHAGAHPKRELAWQGEGTFLWIREPFLSCSPWDWAHDVVVVHGHSPGSQGVFPHRIGLDCGAPTTGVLSAVEIAGDRLRFVSALSDDADDAALPSPAGQGL